MGLHSQIYWYFCRFRGGAGKRKLSRPYDHGRYYADVAVVIRIVLNMVCPVLVVPSQKFQAEDDAIREYNGSPSTETIYAAINGGIPRMS